MKKYRWNKKKFLKNMAVVVGCGVVGLLFVIMFIYGLILENGGY